jgi:hypothetical protein
LSTRRYFRFCLPVCLQGFAFGACFFSMSSPLPCIFKVNEQASQRAKRKQLSF